MNINEIDLSKYKDVINKTKNRKDKTASDYIYNFICKSFIVIIVLFSIAIVYKGNSNLKDKISNYFLDSDISFIKIKKIYDKYLGGVLPIKKDDSVVEVFDEKLEYNDVSIYYDGVKLEVEDNYLVPTLTEGMVVFVGDKDNYGYTVIIENLDGTMFWYGNISNTSLKLYDYVEKGSLVGEVSSSLYMVFSKDGNFLSYEDYI